MCISSYLDSPSCFYALEEPTILQVVFDDDVSDSVENELHVLGVCGTGEVRVNLLGFFLLVQVLKLGADVLGGLVVVVGTLSRGEIQSTMRKQQGRMETERQEDRKIGKQHEIEKFHTHNDSHFDH